MDAPFDPRSTYVHLKPSGAEPIPVDAHFWEDLASGRRRLPGRLAMLMALGRDFPHWERHPAGEELILMLSGECDMILDHAEGERRVRLRAGSAFLVPAGIWHRAVVIEPGEAYFITEGEGTEHRPIAARGGQAGS